MRRLLVTATVTALLIGVTAATVRAADQPIAGQATLVDARPLPAWGVLPILSEGGFSGLYPVPGVPNQFWTVSDRGPNGDTFTVGDTTRRPFFSPAFTPSIYRVQVDTKKGEMRIMARTPLKLFPGVTDPARATVGGPANQITGFGNTPANAAANVPVSDEVPTTDTDNDTDIDASDAVLPFDPFGLDTEGIVFDVHTLTFWLVDEYRPSIVQVALDGTILQRLTPQGQNLAALGPAWSGVFLRDILPASYSNRRDNRGFEGVAISPNGRTLYAIVQNPLATSCTGNDPISNEAFQSNNNRSATRIARLDITNPFKPTLTGDFIYTLDTKPDGTTLNSELRISDLFWVGNDKLLVDERDDHAGIAAQGETSTTHKNIYEVDLTNATNLMTVSAANLQCLDALKPTGVAARGVIAGTKTLSLDLGATSASAEYPIGKAEGVVRRANGNFAVVDDNDFQVGAAAGTPTLYIEYGTGRAAGSCAVPILCG